MTPLRQFTPVATACLLTVALHAAAGAKDRAAVEIPFDSVHGVVIVHVKLDGHGPFAMMLDTGADPSIVDLATARSIGMKIASQGGQGSGTGTDANLAYSTRMEAVALGAFQARRVDAQAMDLSGLSKALGVPIQGVLGRSLMKGRVFQIDYPGQVVRFYTVSPLRGRQAAPDTPRRTTLRYRYQDDLLLAGVKVDGQPAVANLDTGSNGAFQFAPQAVGLLGLAAEQARATPGHSTGFNGEGANRTGQVDEVDVGSLVVAHPAAVFYAKGSGRDDVGWSVRIGGAFLKDFVVTIDDVSHRVRIEKP